MNKELVIKNMEKIFNDEFLNIVINQINDYFKLDNSDYQVNHNCAKKYSYK